ncbi:MazG nucleotide pyrophosphohydrolase [Alkaliphilus metalliredigens QYMF]|uniref:MazG nucleotide pyrophosphohydrolase n=1 Tax=Alkaliphilus metalliredigens (strain QYMF) TaxID=293826 RepID=A6TWA8_ALKMQ|nr:nucleotide pyrophosphohydrolase [Alkaliphilus metalliredigens]ABR50476.1 MazG nucleotide pyrophosphohydrolase [Alkaliphilus metalliredigens QYMF]
MMDRDLTIKEMQEKVDKYISQFEEGYFSPLALMARLTEETGELAREVNHYYGEKPKRKDEPENSIDMELADCMFILACFANSLNIDLEDAFDRMMDKFNTRDANRWTRKKEA